VAQALDDVIAAESVDRIDKDAMRHHFDEYVTHVFRNEMVASLEPGAHARRPHQRRQSARARAPLDETVDVDVGQRYASRTGRDESLPEFQHIALKRLAGAHMGLDNARHSGDLAIVERARTHPLDERFHIVESRIKHQSAARVLIVGRRHGNFHKEPVAGGGGQFESLLPLDHVSIGENAEIGKVMHAVKRRYASLGHEPKQQ